MTDDAHIELASAYLDGEATAVERARVEDAPALTAEVERLRAVRAVVADVPEPRVSTREQHLAAALQAWDRRPAERDATPRSTRTDRVRRSPATVNRWMLAAAAGLVVVLAGGLTLRSLTDRDTDDPTATAEVTDDADDAESADDAATADDAEPPVAEDDSLALSEAVEVAEEAAADPLPPDPDTADLDTDPATDEEAAAPPPEDGLVVLTTSVDLASFAADALTVDGDVAAANAVAIDGGDQSGSQLPDDARTIPPADEASLGAAELPSCAAADVNVGPAIYDDVEVVVAVDAARRWALAYAIDDCQLVAQARLDTAE